MIPAIAAPMPTLVPTLSFTESSTTSIAFSVNCCPDSIASSVF